MRAACSVTCATASRSPPFAKPLRPPSVSSPAPPWPSPTASGTSLTPSACSAPPTPAVGLGRGGARERYRGGRNAKHHSCVGGEYGASVHLELLRSRSPSGA